MISSDYTVGCDAHKHFSLFAILDKRGELIQRIRVDHAPGEIRAFLSQFPEGTPVALETVGNYYWIVDEIERAGCLPLLAHAAKAKIMMGNIHKTDKLDAYGLAILLYLGKLPSVWIPPGDVRDERELPRTRMTFSQHRARVKNRIQSTLAKYALSLDTHSDIFTPKWRRDLLAAVDRLPEETARCVHQQLDILDAIQEHIKKLEARILERIRMTPTMQLIQSVPGPAKVLAIVIDRELGSIDRFPGPKNLSSYCGLVPKVKASAGRVHYGRMVKQCNTYLKWAFIEAANVIVRQRHHPNWRGKYVVHLYERIRRRKGHTIAIGAVARYLAEATYWVLKKREPYREPPHWKAAGKQSLSRSARVRSVANMGPMRSAS
ncbi:MAG TPA: IS110 family transposase [Chloroflexi bacterium]|nr:IS110 family transposase [Chloroflexota bacterium]